MLPSQTGWVETQSGNSEILIRTEKLSINLDLHIHILYKPILYLKIVASVLLSLNDKVFVKVKNFFPYFFLRFYFFNGICLLKIFFWFILKLSTHKCWFKSIIFTTFLLTIILTTTTNSNNIIFNYRRHHRYYLLIIF